MSKDLAPVLHGLFVIGSRWPIASHVAVFRRRQGDGLCNTMGPVWQAAPLEQAARSGLLLHRRPDLLAEAEIIGIDRICPDSLVQRYGIRPHQNPPLLVAHA